MRLHGPFLFLLTMAVNASAATVMVLPFHNQSQYSDLNWVGESVAQTLQVEFGAANQIVVSRDSRAEGLRRLGLRPDADFTKGSLVKLGQNLDVDFLCYGSFDVKPSAGQEGAALKDSSIQIAAHFLDLRKLRDGKDLSEAGKLTELSRLEEHLAWQSLAYLDSSTSRPMEQFLTPQKFIKLEAKESFARGLLSSNQDGQAQWFRQANMLDSRFASPPYELGRLSLARKDYRGALSWFAKINSGDSRYSDARFRMGLAAYRIGEFNGAVNYWRDVAKILPLNEVYNNLGAAENQLGMTAALDDLRRAAEGDRNDPVYCFNLGAVLLKNNQFDEAARWLSSVLEDNPEDNQAKNLLERSQRHEPAPAGSRPLASDRLKQNLDETAFRQLKALVETKSSGPSEH